MDTSALSPALKLSNVAMSLFFNNVADSLSFPAFLATIDVILTASPPARILGISHPLERRNWTWSPVAANWLHAEEIKGMIF